MQLAHRNMPCCAVLWGSLVSLLAAPCAAKLVTFDNTKPRLTSGGANIKAHDGTTQRFGKSGPFYYHAMGYPGCNETGRINGCNTDPEYGKGGKTCIYGHNNSLLVYSSPDLSSGSWKLEEQVYPGGGGGFPECTYFRSQAVYNPKTTKYVLWANIGGSCSCKGTPNGKCGSYAVGTSDAAAGPYKFAGTTSATAASMYHSGGQGDEALFVDTGAQLHPHSSAVDSHGVTFGAVPRTQMAPATSCLPTESTARATATCTFSSSPQTSSPLTATPTWGRCQGRIWWRRQQCFDVATFTMLCLGAARAWGCMEAA